MKDQFNYESQLIEIFGNQINQTIQDSHQKLKSWSQEDWKAANQSFDQICQELTSLIHQKVAPDSDKTLEIVEKHYNWLKKFWTPTKETYQSHRYAILNTDLRQTYEAYHPDLAEFLAKGIETFTK